MDKTAHEKMAQVLAEAAPVIRSLVEERDHLAEKVARLERRDQAEKVASEMHRKGLEMDTSFEDLVLRLEKAAEQGKLEVVQQAVEFVAPDMGAKLAHLTSDEERVASSSSDLERFIYGGVG